MRIRSGHVVVLILLVLGGMLGVVLLYGGGTQAVESNAPARGASAPAFGADASLVPQIEVETTEKDMGVVSNTELTRKPFKVRNLGKATLLIREVKTSCACTTAVLTPDGLEIPAGREASFDIQIDPRRIPGFETRKELTISSNDPKNPQVLVGVTSHVDPEFSIEPKELDFGEVEKGSPATIRMVVKQLREEPLEVIELDTFGQVKKDSKEGASLMAHARLFEFSMTKRPEASWEKPGKAEYDLTASLAPGTPAGPIAAKFVYLKTNVARMPAMALPVRGTVVAPYTLTPQAPMKLNMKMDPFTGTFGTAEATVTAQAPVTLEALDAQGAPLTVTAQPGATPNEVRLAVTVREDAPPGALEAEVKFTVVVDGKRYPESVGVRAFVAKNPAQPSVK